MKEVWSEGKITRWQTSGDPRAFCQRSNVLLAQETSRSPRWESMYAVAHLQASVRQPSQLVCFINTNFLLTATPPPDNSGTFDRMPYKQNASNGPEFLKPVRAMPPRVDTSAASERIHSFYSHYLLTVIRHPLFSTESIHASELLTIAKYLSIYASIAFYATHAITKCNCAYATSTTLSRTSIL